MNCPTCGALKMVFIETPDGKHVVRINPLNEATWEVRLDGEMFGSFSSYEEARNMAKGRVAELGWPLFS